jgi:putative FmdB family regulatory protein
MPIYEYRCQACGVELEKLQKISDPQLKDCPECGRETLVKLVSASSFRLKGSGWYESDFKTGKKKNGLAEDNGRGGEGSSGTVATDAKSADTSASSTDSTKAATASSETKMEAKSETKTGSQESVSASVKTQATKPLSKDS